MNNSKLQNMQKTTLIFPEIKISLAKLILLLLTILGVCAAQSAGPALEPSQKETRKKAPERAEPPERRSPGDEDAGGRARPNQVSTRILRKCALFVVVHNASY